MGIIIGLYGVSGFMRSEFFPNAPILKDITPLLPSWAWILIIIALFFIITFEGAYRLVRKAKDNYVDNYRYNKGRWPPIPPELEGCFIGYHSGDAISEEIQPKPMGIQTWNHQLSPTNKRIWRDIVIWLHKDPDEILWQMEKNRPPGGSKPMILKRKR